MSRYFRAVAIDYDGTLTETGPPGDAVVVAIAAFRRTSGRALLVTGRILDELRAAWPAVESTVDAIVAEMGP
jgi:hydroxymethylpyrimidine pyrophosphatase-like HAD family hydrolase